MDGFPAVLPLTKKISTYTLAHTHSWSFSPSLGPDNEVPVMHSVKATLSPGIQSVLSRDAFVGGSGPLPTPQHIDTPEPGTSFARVSCILSNLSPTASTETDLPFSVLSHSVTVSLVGKNLLLILN